MFKTEDKKTLDRDRSHIWSNTFDIILEGGTISKGTRVASYVSGCSSIPSMEADKPRGLDPPSSWR